MEHAEGSSANGRAHDRYPLDIPAVVVVAQEPPVDATIRNISYGGLSVEGEPQSLPLGAEVVVRLAVEPGVEIQLAGIICWRRAELVGVRFEGLRRAARLAVQTLVEEAERSGRAPTNTPA